ncbi:hypothetical protein Bca52824_093273 [Brassica carinata]|uniref:LIM zinc-binding domain-containing protein n=1 Tax=Brassica carinata TaxID=52824 RepID=A0A8X7P6J2_BRACI|nr:hypothetical protein Bca52824_093273 [Brassica carinata]
MSKRLLLVPMGWLTKILKGSSRKYSDGQANRRYNREDRSLLDTPRYSAEGSDFDKEEIECAIALSLSEQEHNTYLKLKKMMMKMRMRRMARKKSTRELRWKQQKKRKKVAQAQIEEEEKRRAEEAELEELEKHLAKARLEEEEVRRAKTQLEEDEQLAKALQESMNLGSPPPGYDSGSVFPSYPFLVPSRICTGCRAEIGHGRFLSCMGGVWHPECFCCHACDKPIIDYEFSMSGNRPYHKLCYKEQHHPKCDVCHNFIPTNPAGLIEYRAHPFWMQKYCPSHERDGTPRCCSCERMEPKDTKYLILDDGRKLCLECLDSAIMDTHECQPLYLEIREFYEGLHMKVEQQIPMLLVERSALNEAMEGEKHGHHHLPETRGLCLSEEQTVTTVLRRPKIGAGYKLIDMITEPCRLVRRCEVTAILILYGLPRLLTGSILAHEMMHAWLRLNGYPNLRPEVEEGICQVLAHMWLESETYAGSTLIDIASSSSSSSSSAAVAIASSKKGRGLSLRRNLVSFSSTR